MAKDQNQTPETQDEDYKGILGDYTEQEETPDTPQESESGTPQKNNALKVIGISVASAAILGCLGFLGVRLWNNRQVPAEEPTSQTQDDQTSVSTIQDDNIALASENFSISPVLMECFYRDYLSQYSSALTYYGVDTSVSLKEQKLPEETGEDMTWFDYFMSQAQNTAEQILIFTEAANADGYTMTEEDKQSVEELMASLDMSVYGDNVTEDDVRKMYEMQALAASYFNHILESLEFSDEDYESYYEENKLSFDTCGIMGFTISYDDPDATEAADETAETESESGLTQEQAKAFADQLQAVASPEEFETIVCDILRTYEGYTEEELENIRPSISNESFSYTEGSSLAEWAFSDDTKVNDTTMIEGENRYSVYLLIREAGRDNTETVNVRHILYATDNHTEELSDDADEAAVSAAEEAALAECWKLAEDTLAEWEAGDKTEDSFAALAEQYTEDPGSQTTGGLYENVSPGQMVTAFNDWCFDTSRQSGDTGLVETNYGVHVMYFSGTAFPIWKANAQQALQNKSMNSWFEEQASLWEVTFNQEVIDNIEG